MKKIHKKSFIIVLLFVTLFSFSSCGWFYSTEDLEIYGDDMVSYSVCFEEGKSSTVSIPIITNKKVKKINFLGFVSDDSEAVNLKLADVSLNEISNYNGYFVQFVGIELGCNTYDKAVDANITKLLFEVQGKRFEYNTPHFNIKNTCYYTEKNIKMEKDSCIKIIGEFTGIYGKVPDSSRRTDLTITSSKDVIIKSYTLIDFLKIEDLYINKDRYSPSEINFKLKRYEEISLIYGVGLEEGIQEDDIIRASIVLIYEYEGEDYLWLYTPGIYIWKDFNGYENIKRYIDDINQD